MSKRIVNIAGIPFFTALLFAFERTDPQFYLSELAWSCGVSAILWFGNGLIIMGLDRTIPWRNPAAPRIFIQVGLSTILTAWVTYGGLQFLYAYIYEAHFSNLVFRRGLFLLMVISWLYNAIYTGHHFFAQWRHSIIEAEELKRQSIESQYESLKDQINPHFLFNSINTLIGLIDEDPELAKEYGHYFAKVYRYILDKGREELIPLKEELQIIDIQRKLLDARFGKGLVLNVNVPLVAQERLVPPLCLQMLLENAVKHNMASEDHPLNIDISVTDDDEVEVRNNIQRKNAIQSTQLGLSNIKRRYALMTTRPITVTEGDFFTVKLPLLEAQSK